MGTLATTLQSRHAPALPPCDRVGHASRRTIGAVAAVRRAGTITRTVFLRELQAVKDERDDIARRRAKLQNPVHGIVVTPEQKVMLAGPPDTLAGFPSHVVEFWRGVIGAVFEQVIIKPAGKGRRFSPYRVQLISREGYEGIVWPMPAAKST